MNAKLKNNFEKVIIFYKKIVHIKLIKKKFKLKNTTKKFFSVTKSSKIP